MPPKKNPVAARIKRMMQADDEVGKIAQATPVLVCTSSAPLDTPKKATADETSPADRPTRNPFPCSQRKRSTYSSRS